MCTYIYTYMHTCIHTCIHMHMHTHMHAHIHTQIHTYTYTCTCLWLCACTAMVFFKSINVACVRAFHSRCRLRQCCCHLSLLTSALHRNESDQDDLDLELAMGGLSLGEGGHGGGGEEDGGRGVRDKIPSEFATGTRSTKVCNCACLVHCTRCN